MEDDDTTTSVEQISELPLDERAAAFSVLERQIRQRLDEQSR